MSLRPRLLAPLTAALVGAVVVGLLSLAPAPATASPRPVDSTSKADGLSRSHTVFARSSYLCYGYQSCKAAGMTSDGYAQANTKMYWQMYSGHNCTNYAAYRMVKSGLPNQRPWSGGGNATYWGTSMPRLTSGVPNVGAVAWWKANTGPAGSAGHVAYVERVVSADEIVVSQDSWGGDFSWAIITRSSGNWPSGFIHFNDVPMLNKGVPVVSGIAKVGATLSATAGVWKPSDATVGYQWYADGVAVKGATSPTLLLSRKRLGAVMTVTTTGTKLGYPTTSVTSAPTAAVEPGVLRNTAPPTFSGEVQVDHTLSLAGGTWNPVPDALAYQWFADGEPITGATGTSLDLTPDLAGAVITATVTATRAGYDPVSVTTVASEPVAPGTITVTRDPSITGEAKPRQTLTLDEGAYKPTDADVAVQWLRDGVPVLNATGPTYLLTRLDLGTRISAEVTVTRHGYTTRVVDTPATAIVRSTPRIGMQREKLNHRVKLTLTVHAPDVTEVTGTVVVRVQGGFKQEVTLRNGQAHLSVTDLPKGKRSVRITYTGSPTVERFTRTAALWMP